MANDEPKIEPQDSVVQEGKIFAIIGYLGVLCLVPLLLKKDNKFAFFHGKQGLVLLIGETGALVVSILPILGDLIRILAMLVFGVLSLVGIVQALMGNYWRMPVIADMAEKISL